MAHKKHSDIAVGSKCDLYIQSERRWVEGQVIGGACGDRSGWIKVQCGEEILDIGLDDPSLKIRHAENRGVQNENRNINPGTIPFIE